jgi:hypothetical protein
MTTTTNWNRAVARSPKNDHLRAQIPRSVLAMAGSMIPWR